MPNGLRVRGLGELHGKRSRRQRLALFVGAAAVFAAVNGPAFGQVTCAPSYNTTVSNFGCQVSAAGASLTLINPANYSGWVIFNGVNTSMTINSGAFFSNSAGPAGNTTFFAGIVANSSSWSLTNNGSITSGNPTNWDLIGLRATGTFTINNTGSIQNSASDSTANAIETGTSTAITANLNLTNSGTISGALGAAINLLAAGTVTITNNSGGTISSQARAIDASGAASPPTMTLRNAGTISTSAGATSAAVVMG